MYKIFSVGALVLSGLLGCAGNPSTEAPPSGSEAFTLAIHMVAVENLGAVSISHGQDYEVHFDDDAVTVDAPTGCKGSVVQQMPGFLQMSIVCDNGDVGNQELYSDDGWHTAAGWGNLNGATDGATFELAVIRE